jgi:hypothetical protein
MNHPLIKAGITLAAALACYLLIALLLPGVTL